MFKSTLFDESTFYKAFINDLECAKHEVIIESPFITSERMKSLWPAFYRLLDRKIQVYVVTRDPSEHSLEYGNQSEFEIGALEVAGIQVFLCRGNHHRKLAIIDRNILWEGSLNILSQIQSREIMRRFENGGFAIELFNFIGYQKYIKKSFV